MATKSYVIWRDKKLDIGWAAGRKDDIVRKSITWNPAYTTISGVTLSLLARANGRTNLSIYINENEAIHFHWELWEDLATKSETVDVTGNLINGENVFRASFFKDPAHPFYVYTIFSVTLVVTYEGEEPEVEPPWLTYLKKYGVPAAIGVGGLTVGAVIASRRRK